MDVKNARFMEALKASLENRKVKWEAPLSRQEWMELFQLAKLHHVLPMIYEAVYACPAARCADADMLSAYRGQVMRSVHIQIMKTSEFMQMLSHLIEAGVKPVIVKGIVCRDLYPVPDYRMSGDEDVLVPAEQFALCDKALRVFGMTPVDVNADGERDYEVPYGKPGSPIYIELHKTLFPPESEAYGDLNRFFEKLHARRTEVTIQGTVIPTMAPTDHLFYLICHAFKHFLHSGFGIRQVCDIILFANRYGSQVDWNYVLNCCREIHAEYFAAAVFEIGRKYLTFDPQQAEYPKQWKDLDVDGTAMLEDLLEGGVYGDANMSRKHSSNMTLDAVSASKKGKQAHGSLMRMVFPTARKIENKYSYLRKYPFLLPVAWVSRIGQYMAETRRIKGNTAADSIRIGRERIDLMRKYRIIR